MDDLKNRLLALMEKHFPEVEPYEKRSYYMRGDDQATDRRDDERSAIDDFIDVLMEDDAWLKPVQASAWEEGKRAMIEYSQGARRKVPYPVNPYKEA